MHKFSTLLILAVLISFITLAQTENNFTKQFRIESGFGYSNQTKNSGKGGTDFWVQFDYRLAKNFSMAMEGDFMNYKLPSYIPEDTDYRNVLRNNFSLLVKYHFLTNKKFDIAFASGWTYSTAQTENFSLESHDSLGFSILEYISSYSDYRMPLIAQATYSLSKKLELTARVKFDLTSNNLNTYSAGVGLDLKL